MKVLDCALIRVCVCSKILYTNGCEKMAYANIADTDQTAPLESTLFAISLNILRKYCVKSKI